MACAGTTAALQCSIIMADKQRSAAGRAHHGQGCASSSGCGGRACTATHVVLALRRCGREAAVRDSWMPVGRTCAPAGQELELLFRQVRVRVRIGVNSNVSFCTAVGVFPCMQWGVATPAGGFAALFGKELARRGAARAELQLNKMQCTSSSTLRSPACISCSSPEVHHGEGKPWTLRRECRSPSQ